MTAPWGPGLDRDQLVAALLRGHRNCDVRVWVCQGRFPIDSVRYVSGDAAGRSGLDELQVVARDDLGHDLVLRYDPQDDDGAMMLVGPLRDLWDEHLQAGGRVPDWHAWSAALLGWLHRQGRLTPPLAGPDAPAQG